MGITRGHHNIFYLQNHKLLDSTTMGKGGEVQKGDAYRVGSLSADERQQGTQTGNQTGGRLAGEYRYILVGTRTQHR